MTLKYFTEDQEERIKNKKYRSLKMFPSDIILKFKNIVTFNLNKLLKLKYILLNELKVCTVYYLFLCCSNSWE